MKKIIMTTLIGISVIGFSLTNKEIIEQGGVRQKQTFDKYFNGTVEKSKRDPNLLNKVYPEIVLGLYNRNKQTFENELARVGKMKDGRKNILKPLLPSFNEYISENLMFSKSFLLSFLEEKDDFQSYIYTTTFIGLENFYLNMNTVIEAEEDYKKMSNSELDKLVSDEFRKLNAEIDKKILLEDSKTKKQGNAMKTQLKKVEKLYNKYEENFETYVNSLRLKAESKEKIKKLVKFEKLSNLKFLAQNLEKTEGKKDE